MTEPMEVDKPKNTRDLFNELSALLREARSEEAKRMLTRTPILIDTKDDSGRGTVHYAAVGGCLPILKFSLLAKPTAANEADDMGWTPLMIAASAGRVEIVEYLLEQKEVDPKTANKNGQTSLHYAASKNHQKIVRSLVEAGADINAADKYGATALHRASSQGHDLLVRYLLSNEKIRLDPRDSEGNTPLHLAVDENREDVAIMLARKGANLETINKEGKTPLQMVKTSSLLSKIKNAANSQ